MTNVIAEIRLASGEVGYYDDYSGIYLNSNHPTAKIYAGMNTTQIRRSIRSGRLRLISGSLSAPAPTKEEKPAVKEVKAKVEVAKEEPLPKVKPEPVVETPAEPVVETPVAEEPVEAPAEEIAEEQVKPKRRSRKKQADNE